MSRFHKSAFIRFTRNLLLISILVAWQVAFAFSPLIQPKSAQAAPVCVNDTAGANDEPGQKDLTKLCIDDASPAGTVHVTWNWDELGTSGANTLDGCALFDTDGDGNINYSVCVTTTGNPAVKQSVTLYSCGDAKIDRCTSPTTPIAITNGTTCSVTSPKNTDPFSAGDSFPNDTEADCSLVLADVGGSAAKLIDVCSYPSAQPNSDPSDCVIIQDKSAKLEVRKDLIPATDAGLFNLQIDSVTRAANVGDNGTTGEVIVTAASNNSTHTVGETAGTNTSLSSYATSIECRDQNGTGSVVASGNTASTSITVTDAADIVCIITNTASSSITIVKDAQPNNAQDFAYTATGTGVTSPFSLDDDSNATLPSTRTFSNLGAGSYSFTEAAVSGWDFKDIVCSQGASVQTSGSTVTITLAAGQNVTCTYTNLKRGTITVHKVTNPANDPTGFQITASGSGSISGNATRTLTTSQDVVYDVAQGTYGVSEEVPSGWTPAGNTCTSLVIDANNLSRSCTITNTKLAKLKIVKDANPNNAQDFTFSTTGSGLTGFTLDDDSDATLPNNQQFADLSPGDYSVTEQDVTGWDLSDLACTGTSSYSRSTSTLNVTLAAGNDVICTFTNTQRGSIGGLKFNDLNGNSVYDAGEPTLSDWGIVLLSDNQQVGSTTTDVNGNYVFTNLINGTYSLSEILQTGWTQTLAPAPVNLAAGQDSTGNNFGNFQNGSINGFKFNDANGDGSRQESEPKLSGWTIQLFNDNDDQDVLLNNLVTSTTTDINGNYSFTNLPQGTYQVCEVSQTGWVQTFPANDGCTVIVIDQSGESNQANFGNQGRGTIKVVKNVDDGFGNLTQDVTTWTWGYSGSNGSGSNIATGSGNTQSVAAGSYTVTENQKTDYHVTASSCSGEESTAVNTSKSVTVSPGENVTCTFTNTRDTATIEVIKNLRPDTDLGKFNLRIDGVTKATDVGDGGTTGQIKVVTGSHSVSELAGTETSLDDYTSSYECTNGSTTIASGSGTSSSSFDATKDSSVVCIFTNTKLGKVLGIKFNDVNGNHSKDQNESNLSDWTIKLYSCTDLVSIDQLSLVPTQDCSTLEGTTTTGQDGSYSFDNLEDGDYKVCEVQQTGWTQTYPQTSDGCTHFTVNLSENPAQEVTANFGNQGRGTITVVKNVDDGFGNLTQDVTTWTWGYSGDNGNDSDLATGSTNNQSVAAGDYTVSEDQKTDFHVTASSCSGEESTSVNLSKSVTVSPGEDAVCTFTNTRDTGTITVIKNLRPDTDPGKFNLQVNGNTEATNVGDDGTTGQIKVVTGSSHSVSELAGTNTSLDSYNTAYYCSDGQVEGFSVWGSGTSVNNIEVNSDSNIVCTFYNTRLGTLQGVKFNDLNGNSLKDETEPNLSGWTINLYSCDQEAFALRINTVNDNPDCHQILLQTTQTGQDGTYRFDNLKDGDYRVCEVQQAGWMQTLPASNNGCTDFTINLDTEEGIPGQVVTADFGNVKKVVPQVLGEVTPELVNTGQPIVAMIIAGTSILFALLLTTGLFRRTKT